MGSPMAPLYLSLIWVTLKSQRQGHSDCEDMPRKGAQLGHMLLLKINRKPHVGSPRTSSLISSPICRGLLSCERAYSEAICYY